MSSCDEPCKYQIRPLLSDRREVEDLPASLLRTALLLSQRNVASIVPLTNGSLCGGCPNLVEMYTMDDNGLFCLGIRAAVE